MNPRFPIYIPSKSRYDSRLTMKVLDRMQVPYYVIIEEQEYSQYAAVLPPSRLLILDKAYQRNYDTCDDKGLMISPGPGPARNFAWDHALAHNYSWHWVMDDNIWNFYYRIHNRCVPALDGAFFYLMEEFVLRFKNIGMAGPCYDMFAPRTVKRPPFVLNTRIYSCNLIRNDLTFRWRGRYNEDTDLSLRILKDGWCTVQFIAFLAKKIRTQLIKGGNTQEFYSRYGTLPKSKMLVMLHPDVTKLTYKFRRWHHEVDYSPFKKNKLIPNPDYIKPLDLEYEIISLLGE
jgi:hypothetical protein